MTQIKCDKSPWMENLCQFSFNLGLLSSCFTLNQPSPWVRRAQTRLGFRSFKNKIAKSWSFKGVNRARCDVLKSRYFSDCWTGTKSWSENKCEKQIGAKAWKHSPAFPFQYFPLSTSNVNTINTPTKPSTQYGLRGSESLLFIIYVENLTLTQ